MASANFLKVSRKNILGMTVHFDEVSRTHHAHSNLEIDKTKSYLNYNIGGTWEEIVEKCLSFIDTTDEEYPPQRNRIDRKIADFLYVPCPLDIERQGRCDDFFQDVYQWTMEFFSGRVAGAQIHKDEKHQYLVGDEVRESMYHMHILIPCYAVWKDEKGNDRIGINSKNFNSKKMYTAYQQMLNKNVRLEYGVDFNTGDIPNRKSVEELKIEGYQHLKKQTEFLKEKVASLETEYQKLLDDQTMILHMKDRIVTAAVKTIPRLQEQLTDIKQSIQSLSQEWSSFTKEEKEQKKRKSMQQIQFISSQIDSTIADISSISIDMMQFAQNKEQTDRNEEQILS